MSANKILEAMEKPNGWKNANPTKRFPPRMVRIIDGPINVGKVGFVMSRFAGKTQIATGVCENGTVDCTWYSRWQFEKADGKNRDDFGTRRKK